MEKSTRGKLKSCYNYYLSLHYLLTFVNSCWCCSMYVYGCVVELWARWHSSQIIYQSSAMQTLTIKNDLSKFALLSLLFYLFYIERCWFMTLFFLPLLFLCREREHVLPGSHFHGNSEGLTKMLPSQ